MDSNDHIQLAAFQELQYALKVKRMNEELFEQLVSSLRWLLHYRQKYNIPLPDTDKILNLLNRITTISDKLSDDRIQSDKNELSDEEDTEPNIAIFK
jgi:hypothetical protein